MDLVIYQISMQTGHESEDGHQSADAVRCPSSLLDDVGHLLGGLGVEYDQVW
jgi:hypothetical protein